MAEQEHDSTLTCGARYHKLQGPPSPPPPPPTKEKQLPDHRPIANFLSSRAVFLLLFVFLILPLFPSEAPEFVNQTLLASVWELFHLLLVGIAISYGLFSQRNADPASPEKEAADSPQSYLSQLLQVSPVFDDEEPGSPYRTDESRLRMWNSLYQREPPAVVVEAPARPAHDGGAAASRRRLLLPVRSLRTRVMPAADPPAKKDEHRSTFGEMRSPGRPVQKDQEIFDADSVILPSPILWRSRSGRMNIEEESTFRSVSFRSPSIAASSPAMRSPSPDDSPERRSKARRRSWRMEAKDEAAPSGGASPALPSGTLLAENSFRSVSFRPSSPAAAAAAPPRRLSPSPPVSPEPRAKTREDPLTKKTTTFSKQPPPPPPLPPTPSVPKRITRTDGGYYAAAMSVRTVRPREVTRDARANISTSLKTPGERKKKKKNKNNYFSNRVEQSAAVADDAPTTAPSGEKNISNWVEGGDVAADASGHPHGAEIPGAADVSASAAAAEQEENEVDKKADEFIARFREQIRLQRIESIKTTAGPAKT